MHKQLIENEDGVTLVELLAALAILAIIVTSFLAFFIQSARTSSQASHVNEATFLAQQQMEEVVYYSSNFTFKESESGLGLLPASGVYTKTTSIDGYSIRTELSKDTSETFKDAELYKVIITVNEGSTLRAQMENRLPFNKE